MVLNSCSYKINSLLLSYTLISFNTSVRDSQRIGVMLGIRYLFIDISWIMCHSLQIIVDLFACQWIPYIPQFFIYMHINATTLLTRHLTNLNYPYNSLPFSDMIISRHYRYLRLIILGCSVVISTYTTLSLLTDPYSVISIFGSI